MRRCIFTNFLILGACTLIFAPLMIAKEMGHLSGGAFAGLMVLFVAIGCCFSLIVASKKTRKARERFVSTHRRLPDADFLLLMDAAGDYARFCLIVRNGFAVDCGVPAEMIHSRDSVRELERLCFDGFYLDAIIFALQHEFPNQAADIRFTKVFKKWKTITFGECVEGAARELGFLREAASPS